MLKLPVSRSKMSDHYEKDQIEFHEFLFLCKKFYVLYFVWNILDSALISKD